MTRIAEFAHTKIDKLIVLGSGVIATRQAAR